MLCGRCYEHTLPLHSPASSLGPHLTTPHSPHLTSGERALFRTGAVPAPTPLLPGEGPGGRLLLQGGGRHREWLQGGTTSTPPLAVPPTRLRFLDDLRTAPAFKPIRVRDHYPLGWDGMLGIVPGQQVRVVV